MEKEILDPSFHTVQTFMYGHAEVRDIPSEYRWQEDKEEMKADEYHGLSYNRVLAKFLSAKEQNYMASTSATIVGETMDLVKPLCTKDDVFRVRLEMHRAKESYTKEETLFKSEARQDELLNDPNLTKSYCYNAMSNDGLSATSYAHFFHKDPSPRIDYFKPTTLEGDIEYIIFLDKLVELTRYRETRDMVFARAIALARSGFRKMLLFQIKIAVDQCLELMLRGEKMWQRKQLYYHIVQETVLKNKKREDVIQEGQVQLFYDLIEFARLDVDDYKDMVEETLDHLVEVSHDKLPSKESVKNGAYKKMICEELNKLFPRRTRLYMHFLKMKIEAALYLARTTSLEC
ncbi:uncharacterized protein LOC125551094 [Triticum urartu]|uniref:uncharacterized protein LOC119286286 n=1 Tax=Triticum dicoccoides TaxID=85692 RepID=UPI00188E2E95|nr:uncharacterized protein LOC119286286 [Triticum dicoccoides]XP_048570202.1 uncharacterized protein LOC125551094 [Triticum urartu]XP_048570203.1 uncharacterized protein LOC125551094 [Triticum urartu]XP_048570204.1 uncharacterized protein LOC125551094 [Triticum urartu]XP_048570205.1 uncharacterized protein LOC125551094 [Triticum urartu]XP_048570207.1 uncharacterized protein LOC125551094 [Triticum urartu]